MSSSLKSEVLSVRLTEAELALLAEVEPLAAGVTGAGRSALLRASIREGLNAIRARLTAGGR